MNNPQPSKIAISLLDLLREAAPAFTDDDLIAARDYTLAHMFPTGLCGADQDMMVAKVTGGDPQKTRDTVHGLVKPALRRLHYKAQQDRNREHRRDAVEAHGREWDPDEDAYDEWAERIEQSRKNRDKILSSARKSGLAAVASERMDGDTFHCSVSLVRSDVDAEIASLGN